MKSTFTTRFLLFFLVFNYLLNKFNYNDNNLKKNLEKTIQKVNSIETFDNYVKSSNNKISTNDCKIVLVIVVLVFALYLCLKK